MKGVYSAGNHPGHRSKDGMSIHKVALQTEHYCYNVYAMQSMLHGCAEELAVLIHGMSMCHTLIEIVCRKGLLSL